MVWGDCQRDEAHCSVGRAGFFDDLRAMVYGSC
jgi:hypothetical protein